MLFQVGLYLFVTLMLMRWIGVFRKGSVNGPARLTERSDTAYAGMVTILGLIVWFGGSVVLLGLFPQPAAGESAMSTLQPFHIGLLAVLPPMAAFFTMLIADIAGGAPLPRLLGYTADKIPPGLWKGAIGFAVIMPLMIVAMYALTLFYQLIGYEHPKAHQYLAALDAAPLLAKLLILCGATIAAPLFEEMLFRGHIQSMATRAIGKPWVAIFITATLFAVIHEAWSAPPILLLAIALGYAYERTGNLWVPIVMHALFNGTQTVLYLSGIAGR